ncbi:MAG TPA: hypothetical protein VGY76_02880 [Solirubrobacteraceae bacterium]|jgi:hypothetical protein|nr:hypothetical protein [Solirubrobacteraceae bacterium]
MSTPGITQHAQLTIHDAALSSATHSAGGGSLSTGALVAAVAAGLVILACLAWALVRWWAYEPHWLPAARHASAEAGLRLSATWDELRDWMRLGH